MKKLIVSLLAGMVLCGAASTAFAAIEVSGDAYVGVYNKYVWRGYDMLPNDNVSVQSGTDISFKGFTISWWGALEEKSGNLFEADLVLDYSHDFGEMVSASIGNIMYDVDGFKTTNEFYVSASLNTILAPSVTVYYDYDEFNGLYTTFGISHDLELADKLSLGLGAQVSYLKDDQNNLGTTESWLHNAELSAAASYAVNDQVSIDASFLYSGPLTDDARDIAGIREEYVGGLTTTLAF
jgi:hypothetical protein